MTRLSKADKLILRAKEKAGKKRWIRYCPQCKSTDVILWGQLVENGYWYKCRKCDYHAPSFPEKAKN